MPEKPSSTGVFTAEDLRAAADGGVLRLPSGFGPRQLQPASLDLTLGRRAWRVRAAFLPGAERTVADRLSGLALHELDLSRGAVLEKGCVYLIELREALSLPEGVSAGANPKSSTGRIDVFVRLVTDNGTAYERVPDGYEGPLYAEVSPRTFSVLVREGSTLNQLRLRRGDAFLSDAELRRVHEGRALSENGAIGGGLRLSVNLAGREAETVGYRARRHAGLIDVDRTGALDPADFWEPIAAPAEGFIVLDPDEFYILASRETLCVPPDLAAEMVAIDTELGAFRAHYAGFFDPGFGTGAPSRAVLEVRGYDAPFVLEHGQVAARLLYERLTGAPETVYGAGLGSNYQGQGLRLSKHFARG
ncbi:2'-deoxycytidine 5'-triphosphate deaminase [Parvularcula dongshanensis]|uniref:2'-deoxycytidine 5'-triphosphate deaminase n=1 Tax=Parvularcula dongshanensis TaxID=1173995 RepID=UPI00161369E3